MDYIKREIYLNKLIARRNNGEVKVITGSRRSGKSWLLSHVYYDYLLEQGVTDDHIIDSLPKFRGKALTPPVP